MIQTLPFDMSEFLKTNEDIALFEKATQATGDAVHMAHCQTIIEKAKQRIAINHNLSDSSPHPLPLPVKPFNG